MNPKETHPYGLTIVVTDSGLGGLSVTADLEHQLRSKNKFGKIRIIFFNSLAASDFGYNSMATIEKKSEVFDSALNTIQRLYSPNIILIACNTLSVVYEHTKFSKESNTQVIGIIDRGVEMIIDDIQKNPNSSVLLLGTPTTISSLAYHKRLLEKGVREERIINQPCPLLETAIQQNPDSEIVQRMINDFLIEAKKKELVNSEKIIVALCCTHYGYSEMIFHKVVQNTFKKDYILLNPNIKMVEFAVENLQENKDKFSELSVEVVSQVKLKSEEITSIANILRTISPFTASALENYIFSEFLFSFSK